MSLLNEECLTTNAGTAGIAHLNHHYVSNFCPSKLGTTSCLLFLFIVIILC